MYLYCRCCLFTVQEKKNKKKTENAKFFGCHRTVKRTLHPRVPSTTTSRRHPKRRRCKRLWCVCVHVQQPRPLPKPLPHTPQRFVELSCQSICLKTHSECICCIRQAATVRLSQSHDQHADRYRHTLLFVVYKIKIYFFITRYVFFGG